MRDFDASAPAAPVDKPCLASRLVFAPRRVVHTLAAYIHHAIEAQHDITRIGADPVLLAARKAIKWAEPDLRHLKHALKYPSVKGFFPAPIS